MGNTNYGNERNEGKVVWFSNDRGYGFINPIIDGDEVDKEVEYFVHYSNISMKGYKTLLENQKVTFDLVNTDKGVQAVNVNVNPE
jgi:cold shock protein